MSLTLYTGWVLAHSQEPHHQGPLEGATHRARCDNPLCGDRITVHLRVEGDRIAQASFEARACAVAVASASILTDLVIDQPLHHALALASKAQAAVDPDADPPEAPLDHLAVVRTVRGRRRCATLAWESLIQALADTVPAGADG